MSVKARDLKRGDAFMLQLCGEVVETEPVASGARIRIKVELLNMRSLEFTYEGSVIELLVKPGRPFQVRRRRRDDDRWPAPDPAPRPREKVPA
jgi:hypothetical protein